MKIQQIALYRVTLPLLRPYSLSYGPVSALQSLWARIELAGGQSGWGESTPLPGYSDSTLEAVAKTGNSLAQQWIGSEVAETLSALPRGIDGFLYTALVTALEEGLGEIPRAEGCVPLAALAQEDSGESPAETLERMRTQGYQVFKVKVGFHDISKDKARVLQFQESLLPGERLRIDANQSLTFRDGFTLAEACEPEKVEVLEQPYPISNWKQTAELRKNSPVAIMLDEVITDVESLERAVEEKAADAVKLKLMKQGSCAALREMVDKARQLRLKVVFGNGVASCLNNRQEAIFWLRHLQDFHMAGEMNGFLKLQDNIGADLIQFQEGCAFVPASGPEVIDKIISDLGAETILRVQL